MPTRSVWTVSGSFHIQSFHVFCQTGLLLCTSCIRYNLSPSDLWMQQWQCSHLPMTRILHVYLNLHLARQACSSHCNLDLRIGRRQCCLHSIWPRPHSVQYTTQYVSGHAVYLGVIWPRQTRFPASVNTWRKFRLEFSPCKYESHAHMIRKPAPNVIRDWRSQNHC